MARTIKPGLLFQAGVIPEPSRGGLEPTMSTYQYGDRLEGQPRPNTTYVVCKDWSVQDYHDPTRPIGWEILEDEKGWYYRVTEPKPVALYFRGMADPVPEGRSYMDRQDSPQFAEITEQKDDMEDISSIDPLLAQCAAIVTDPTQTAAMAQFARGEMSYAEMRGLCG